MPVPAMNVTDFLTTRPQTKRELAERMGVTTRSVEDLWGREG